MKRGQGVGDQGVEGWCAWGWGWWVGWVVVVEVVVATTGKYVMDNRCVLLHVVIVLRATGKGGGGEGGGGVGRRLKLKNVHSLIPVYRWPNWMSWLARFAVSIRSPPVPPPPLHPTPHPCVARAVKCQALY